MRGGENRKKTGGTTMVEVIVAFAVLVLTLGIFSQALSLAGNMAVQADARLEQAHELAGAYYLQREAPETGSATLIFEGRDGTTFQMEAVLRKYDGEHGTIYDVVPEDDVVPERE